MKTLRAALALLVFLAGALPAIAAPFLLADPYPATGVQPDAASLTVNGGAPITCQLVTVAAGLQPKCDLVSIVNPGTYTLVMTVSKSGGITNTTGGATNTTGSTASSSPFVYRLQTQAVAGPTLSVSP